MKIDKDYIVNFAEEILKIPSPSGYTKEVIDRVKLEAERFKLSHTTTKKGNLIITVPGESDKTIGLGAHVDTLGAMVRSVTAKGGIRFTSVGGPIWPTLDGEYCTIRTRDEKDFTGTLLSDATAIHVHKEAREKKRNPETMFVRLDEKVRSKEDVEKLGIATGDFIFFDPKTTVTQSGFIKSRFLDDKINVASLFGLIKLLRDEKKTPKHTLKIIVSTYEEVGHGSASIPELDEFIAVDMGCVGDDLACTEYDVSICAKDSTGPYDYDITTRFKTLAQKHDIDHTVDIYPYYGSDVSAARSGGNDFKGALIGPGVSASHGMERTHYDAVKNTVKLLYHYVL